MPLPTVGQAQPGLGNTAAPNYNGLPSSFNMNQFTWNDPYSTPGSYNAGISGLPQGWSISDPASFNQGMPSFDLQYSTGNPGMTAGSATYNWNGNGYNLGNYSAPTASDYGGIADQLIQGASMAGLAATGGLAGASAAGLTGGATSLAGMFGNGAAALPAGGSGIAGASGALPASLPGWDAAAAIAANPGSIPALGEVAAGSTPGLAGLGADLSTAPYAGAGFGTGTLDAGIAPGTFDLGGAGTMAGIGGAGSTMLPAAAGGGSSLLSQLLAPGGPNSLLNIQNMGGLGGALYNIFNNPGGNLQQPYNTALGNAGPAINNLNSLLSAGPQGFYNTAVGQGLMASQMRDINAKQSAAGRFGIGTMPNGQGGMTPQIPANGQGVDALNLLNQYMAQQYNNTVNSAAGAASPMLGAINATYPGYNAGNVIGANQLNPLASLFNNPAFANAGNSALQYLWNGIG